MATALKKRKKPLPLFRKTITKKLLPIATFDIETHGMGGAFLDSCIYYGDTEYHHCYSVQDLIDTILATPGYRYYAHNGAGYDFSYLMDGLMEYHRNGDIQMEPIVQGKTRIIGVIITKDKKKLELRDSMALIPMSLKKAAHIFAPDYEKDDINLEEHIYDPTDPVDIAYLHRDCEALFHVMLNFQKKVFKNYGTPIGFTAGTTALYAWQNFIPEGHAYYRCRPQVEDFVRQGYYGGFVYPGHDTDIHENAITIDRNAAFADAMRKGVSTGNPIETNVFEPDYGGMWQVTARVPKHSVLPFLPSRDAQGNLRWCTGTFRTVVTTQEILFARENGCTVEVEYGYYFTRHEYPFDEFLAISERIELERSADDKEASKIQRNALYGKLGMNPHGTNVVLLTNEQLEVGDIPLIDEHTGEPSPYVAFREEENDANYIMPMWAAEITANARIALMRIFLAVGVDNVLYGDTDSCTFLAQYDSATGVSTILEKLTSPTDGLTTISRYYGDIKVERYWNTFQALGPKNYHGIADDGKYYGKAKGIPKRVLTEWKMLMYQMTGFTQVPEFTFDSALSAFMKLKYPDKPIAQPRKRHLSALANSTCWRLERNRVLPLHVQEVMV